MFLNFMVKVDPIMRKIFGLTAGSNTGKLAVAPLMPQIATAKAIGKQVKKSPITGVYGNFLGKTIVKPLSSATSRAGNALNRLNSNVQAQIDAARYEGDPEKLKKAKEKRENREKKAKQFWESAKVGVPLGLRSVGAVAKGAIALPLMMVESELGIEVLSSTVTSVDKVKKTLSGLEKKGIQVKPRTAKKEKKFKLKGIRSRNKKSRARLAKKFAALGMKFKMIDIMDETGEITIRRKTNINNPTSTTNPELRKAVEAKINANKLKFSRGGKNIHQMLDSGEDGSIDRAIAYADILAKARQTERELEQEYRRIVSKTDEQIAAAEKISPEFARSLQDKQAQELEKAALALSKPLTEKDIYKAIETYQSKTPSFNTKAEAFTRTDIEGITKEIDSVLEAKGEDIKMSQEFVKRVEQELQESRKQSQKETKASKEKLHTDDKNNPYSAANGNAPQENSTSTKSSIEDLVKNIQNASKDSSSKEVPAPKGTRGFVKRLEKLEQLSQEAAEITGEEIYNIEDVLEKLKKL